MVNIGQHPLSLNPPVQIKDSHALVIVYDVTDVASFQAVPSWQQSFHAANGKHIPGALIGVWVVMVMVVWRWGGCEVCSGSRMRHSSFRSSSGTPPPARR
jgi:hypothetical protein